MAPALERVHPVLMSRDVAAAIRFYERLGFSATFRDNPVDPKYAAVARDGVELHLQWHDVNQWACTHDRPTYRFLVREVDALHAELLANGMVTSLASADHPWQAPADTPWHTREFHLRDPDGNGLQFYYPL
jgi:catechol 2,3-dioxygenase-like lactoylglutathione lyase family enzyme